MPVYLGKVTETRIEAEVEWRIDDFLSLSDDVDEYYKSPDFRLAAARWSLAIYPHGRSGYNSIGWIGVYLVREDSGHPVALACTLALMTADGKKMRERRFTSLYNEKDCECGTTALLTRLELMKRKLQLMPSDVLTVTCSLRLDDPKDLVDLHLSSCIQAGERFSEKQLSLKKNVPPSSGNLLATVGELTRTRGEADVEWRIADFFSLSKEVDQFYCSPYFFFFGHTCLFLRIYPNGLSVDNSVGWIGVGLTTVGFDLPVMMSLKLGLTTADGKKKGELHFTQVLEKEDQVCRYSRFFSRSELMKRRSEWAPSGVLTLTCSMRYGDPKEHLGKKEPEHAEANHSADEQENPLTQSALASCDDYKDMILGGQACDATINVKGHQFPVHRDVLRSCSPVFARLFDEDQDGVIRLEDCDVQIFDSLLLFVYSGKLDNLPSKVLPRLYSAADKYCLKDLKRVCVEYMRSSLSEESVCDVIHLAKLYSETHLLEFATDFFTRKTEKIFPTTEWQNFMKEHTTEANQLLIDLLKQRPYKREVIDAL